MVFAWPQGNSENPLAPMTGYNSKKKWESWKSRGSYISNELENDGFLGRWDKANLLDEKKQYA